MDRNTVVGFLLIFVIMFGFYYMNQPSEKELAQLKHKQDSIARVQKQKAQAVPITGKNDSSTVVKHDTTVSKEMQDRYGVFASAATGKEETFVLENNLIKVFISSKGGRVSSVQLKNYKTYKGEPLFLFQKDSSAFAIQLPVQNRTLSSADFYFVPNGEVNSNHISLRLNGGGDKFIEYNYSLAPDDYMLNFNLHMQGINSLVNSNVNALPLEWKVSVPSTEKSITSERMATTIYYKSTEESDYLSETSDKKEDVEEPVKWIGFKHQFFTSVLISEKDLVKPVLETNTPKGSMKYVRHLAAFTEIPFTAATADFSNDFKFYFGPNHYKTLKRYGLGLEYQVPLGWGIFGWVNKFLVIPVFNLLSSTGMNYGLIILLLTIMIKLILLPLTYKAYLSQAKMKVLKPEMDEINNRMGSEEPLKKQQEIMSLYKKAGVNPLGGCLPMVLQMPILIAMFRFFPSSLELRQQKFLWADDLSSYDSVWNFGFNIPFYGDHVSLFTLLMTISTIIYTRMNSQMTGAGGSKEQQLQMKIIMYVMPIIFLGVFNNYSAALSYYYFLANVITFAQQYLFRLLVNEDEIHRKIQENKLKISTGKKSSFQQRLEEMAKARANKGKK